jgi:flagellar basal body-associated protein FliL
MDELIALFGTSVIAILILVIFLPQVITTWVMSYKGYSGCLWLFFSLFLSWIGVIIAICMPNVRRQEERHKETIAAIASQNRSQTVIVNNQENEQKQHVPSPLAIDFRLQAIRNLKEIGKPFDDYDLELEIEKIKKEQEEIRLKEAAKREQELQEEQARIEEEKRNRQRIKAGKNAKIFTRLAIVIGVIVLLSILVYVILYFRQNHQLNQEEMSPIQDSLYYNQDDTNDEQQLPNTTETYNWMYAEGNSKKYPLKSQIKFTDTEIKCITTEGTDTYIITGNVKQKTDNKDVLWEYPVYYSPDKNQKIMSIVKGADYTMIIYDDEGYYELFSKTKPEHYKVDDIEDILQQSVVEWNGAHSLDFVKLWINVKI